MESRRFGASTRLSRSLGSVAEAEGMSTPELDALVAEGAERAGLHTADPLAGAALNYAQQIAIRFVPIAELVARAPIRRSGPEPEEVLLWYHVRIYLRLDVPAT